MYEIPKSHFFKTHVTYIQELSVRGWNWGKTECEGDELSFTLDDGKVAFDIPLVNVSNCVQNKNEVTLEFHQNDDDKNEVTMMECRFHMPYGNYNTRNPKTPFFRIFVAFMNSSLIQFFYATFSIDKLLFY